MKNILTFIYLLSILNLFAQNKKQPKLVVGIVVDQMCYEFLYRYQNKFSDKGFVKLITKGSHCRNTQYNYVPTFTGPGHASIYTGTTPSNHGIVANDWYDRNTGKSINCVGDSTVLGVGTSSEEGKCSPINLKSNTITDQLRLTYPDAKVISMSIKDRGAILPGGHLSNGSYWFDYSQGKFVTSTFYKQQLPFWVQTFNEKNYPKNCLTKTWDTYYDISTYKESGPDNTIYEELVSNKKTPTFPYNLNELSTGKNSYELFTFTPFANTYLTDFAIESIYNEMLGQDSHSDFLCISYSTPDIAGHMFGPYSVELEDIYIRLDLELARLIEELEKKVGKDNFVLFLTADHAVVPVPQYLVDHKLPGGYLYKESKILELIDQVKVHFGADLILNSTNNNIYLDQETMTSLSIDSKLVEKFISGELRKWEEVKAVFTTDDFISNSNGSNWLDMIRLGFHPKESGEIIYILEPGYLPKSKDTEESRKGTSHGSAFNYDSHVPLIWYGKNIKKQDIFRRVNIIDITATLTHILNLQKPNATTGEPILEILDKK
jgi:predicted AlkP superfamily pyrophosphatase or phosphodiesterase